MPEQQLPLFPELPPAKRYGPEYPAAPGSGPDGKQCRHCEHYFRNERKWSKCSLTFPRMGKTGSDISMYSPACSEFVDEEALNACQCAHIESHDNDPDPALWQSSACPVHAS